MEVRGIATLLLSVVALGSLGVLMFSVGQQRLPVHVFRVALFVGGMIILAWTWYALFWYMTVRTEALLDFFRTRKRQG